MRAKIAIASTLKPVIDPRAYEKIGCSLTKTAAWDIHIIGSEPSIPTPKNSIIFHSTPQLNSIFQRLLLPWKIYSILRNIKPILFIITSHELLIIGCLLKYFSGCRLLYDVQENYFFNLIYQKNYPWGVKHLLAFYVRSKELFFTRFVDHFLLAEQCYVQELSFIKERFTILENKFVPLIPAPEKQESDRIELILSGTISREYGVLDAINFVKQLPDDKYRLRVVGHCPNLALLNQIKLVCKNSENILVEVSTSPIPHSRIMSHLTTNTIALLPYKPNKSTINKVPTKLYEFIGMGIPVIISPNTKWEELIEKHQAGRCFDFSQPTHNLNKSYFISLINKVHMSDLKDVMWINEEIKLISLINNLLKA